MAMSIMDSSMMMRCTERESNKRIAFYTQLNIRMARESAKLNNDHFV